MTIRSLAPATTVGVLVFPGIVHQAIVTDSFDANGEQTVISASGGVGSVTEQPMNVFSGGRKIFILPELRGDLPHYVVVERARERLGKPYRLFSHNCEHFVREVQGIPKRSPQLSLSLVIGCLALAFVISGKRAA
ncbi:MAG: lecithin retinol acyltransferase family protein [Alphaproteobacteria bacterium]